jgi:hypothetical protein
MSVIPALERWRQEDQECKASLDSIERLCQKKKKGKKEKERGGGGEEGREGGRKGSFVYDFDKHKIKDSSAAGFWWLTPVILATQKAEIRGIKVQSQSGQMVCETLSQKCPTHTHTQTQHTHTHTRLAE